MTGSNPTVGGNVLIMADPQRGVSLRHLRLDLCDPEVVVLAIFNDRTYRDLPLLQRVWLGGDRLHLGKLQGHTKYC